MGRKLANNNGSQDALLRSVKADAVAVKLDNSLKPNEKALAQSILDTLLEKMDASDDYLLRLSSKDTDATLGRIEELLEKAKISSTASEISAAKEAILQAIEAAVPEIQTNASLDVEKAVKAIAEKLDSICQILLQEMKASLSEALGEKPTSEMAEEPAVQPESEESSKSDQQAVSDLVDKACSALNSHIDAAISKIDTYFVSLSDQIASVQNKIVEAISGLTPSKKELKEEQKQKKAISSIQEMMAKVQASISKIDAIIADFAGFMLKHLKKFLAGAKKMVVGFILDVLATTILPIMLLIAGTLYIVAKPLMQILQPIMDFLKPILLAAIDLIQKVLTFVQNDVWPFLKDFIVWIRDKIITPIWEAVVLPLLTWFAKTFMGFMDNVVIPLITAIADILTNFFNGLATKAYDIGVGLGNFVTEVLAVLTELVRGFGTKAFEIGQAIGVVVLKIVNVVGKLVDFIGVVVDIITEFFKGFQTQAKAIGEVFGKVILEISKFVLKLAQFINLVADIIIDFFTPFKPVVKKLAQVIADTLMTVLGLISAVLGGIKRIWTWIRDKLAEVTIWKWKPFSFLKGGAPAGNDGSPEENKDPGFTARVNELLDRINSGVLWQQIAAAIENTLMKNKLFTTIAIKVDSLLFAVKRFFTNIGTFIRTLWKQLKSGELFTSLFDAISKNPTFKKLFDGIDWLINTIGTAIDDLTVKVSDFIDNFTEILKKAFDTVADALVKGIEFAKTQLERIVGFLGEVKASLVSGIDFLKEKIGNVIDKLGNSLDGVLASIQSSIVEIKDAIVRNLDKIVDGILNLPEKAVNLIVKAIKGILNIGKAIGNAVGGAFNKVKGWFGKDKKEEAVQLTPAEKVLDDKLVSLTEMLKNTASAIDSLNSFNEGLFTKAAQLLSDTFGAGLKAICDLPTTLSDAVSSIGKTFEEVGAKLLQPVTNVLSSVTDIAQSVIKTIPAVLDTIVQGVSGIVNSIANMPVEIAKGLTSVISGITGVVGDLGKGVFNTVTDTVDGITDGIVKLFSFGDDDKQKISDAALKNIQQGINLTDSINARGKAPELNLGESENVDFKKASKEQEQFNSALMNFLTQKFDEVFEKLSKQGASTTTVIPLGFNSNYATMENM